MIYSNKRKDGAYYRLQGALSCLWLNLIKIAFPTSK
jgi:hypothetical protein